jgi:glycosyltransferase involved in cell wall biosynthesis
VAVWAAAIARVASDDDLRSVMGAAAAGFVAESLSLDAAADRLVRAYWSVAGANGHAP